MDKAILFGIMPDQPTRSVFLCESDDADKKYVVHLCRVWGEKHIYVETMTECDDWDKAYERYKYWRFGI